MYTFFIILTKAPFWVWIVLIMLIKAAIAALKTRTVPLKKLLIMPSIFFLWGFYSLMLRYNIQAICIWPLTLLVGCYIGWQLVKKQKFKIDRKEKTIILPGSPALLLISLPFFIFKFAMNYSYARYPTSISSLTLLDVAVSGIISGQFIGKSLLYYSKFRESVSVEN